jgi:CubicO group peptidase (beta-lactamase class C family)
MNFRHLLHAFSATAVLVLAAGSLASAEGTFDIPKGAHFNKQKLEKIGEFFRNEIATEKIPGAILLIQQHGKPVYHEFFGVRDTETKAPMTDDTIFRLFSMTKPITSVAAMLLLDQHKIKIDDPIAIYIPSFATTKVGVEKKSESGEKTLQLEPLKRRLTI